jgi:uncharacterized protein
MSEYRSTERHPFISLLLLLALALAGIIVFTVLACITGGAVYGIGPLLEIASGKQTSLSFLKLIQIFSSIGMFVFPPLVLARLESRNWMAYLRLNRLTISLFLLTILIVFSSGPLLEWTAEINRSMKLPMFLKGMEDWMRSQEIQLSKLTKQLLMMNSIPELSVNLLMIAVIPALGEELFFRGGLQQIFSKWFKNHHISIWLTAIIFSAIHIQFYGFLPRMLLGALFGYLLVWSKSLWLPILAHFLNNATAVITAYTYQREGISLDQLDQAESFPWPVYLISFAATLMLLWFFYTRSLKQTSEIAEQTDGARLG